MVAFSKNSPKTGAGVDRRRGRGPLHGLITGLRAKCRPTSEVEAARGRTPEAASDGGGETDGAHSDLQNKGLTSSGERGHDLDSTEGKPIFAQNSFSTSSLSLSGSMSRGATSGSTSIPSQATSSASSLASSSANSTSSRQRNREPDGEVAAAEDVNDEGAGTGELTGELLFIFPFGTGEVQTSSPMIGSSN
jgi:hypothetical protein